ncbi:DUF1983 domain-containing protein [Azotobacter bryophylli]|uniref:DUF1983 domain-containing protein n=1 Tax=Azotobacter bryophylli TaxID=1986537 RepID=A0ABV7AZN3_9GAMM
MSGVKGIFSGLSMTPKLGSNEPSAQTVRSSKAPARYLLGRVNTGGVLAWVQEQAGSEAQKEWLHLVYVLSEGAIAGMDEITLDEQPIASFGGKATYEVIIDPVAANAYLLANCPDWQETQIGRGLSFVRLSLKYDSEKFPTGIPQFSCVVRGRADIYDPRSGAEGYSENTALHLLWFLRHRCGVPDDEIVFETFAAAANVCDETVTNPDGTTSPRYRTAAVIGADESRADVLKKLTDSCGGRLLRVGGKWMLQAGAYYGPAEFEITEDMVIGTITGTTEVGNDSAINTVRGTFIDPSQAWAETDYPDVVVDAWVLEDGGESAESLSFGYVTDVYQAQRLANLELRRRRAGGTLKIPLNFAGYNCRPGRVVSVNLPSLNIAGEFIVSDWSMDANSACSVTLAQYGAQIFDDAVGQPYSPLGFIALPAGGIGAPTGLSWTPLDAGETVQGLLSWTAPSVMLNYYSVVVRQNGVAIQAIQVPGAATQCPISGLTAGSYTLSISAQGPTARSGEATIGVEISGPPVPETCAVQATVDTLILTPGNVLKRLNGGTYEFYYALSDSVPPEQATYLGQGLSFAHTGLSFATTYYYFIRSVNAYGKSGFLAVAGTTSADIGALREALAGQIGETQLAQHLVDRISPPLAGGDWLAGDEQIQAGVWSQQYERETADSALAVRIDTVEAAAGENSAAIQQTSQALASLDGSLQAMWSVKLQVTQDGKYYAAGMGLGIENTPAGLQSQILFQADRFAVINTANGAISTPFVIQSGQVFINSAVIGDGTITSAKIAGYLQSTNYVAGQTGWKLSLDGPFEINGAVANKGRMMMNNQAIKFWDANNVLRVQLGDQEA